MELRAGDTFINADRPDIGRPAHLWIVLSDPEKNAEQILIVNLSSLGHPDRDDDTCVVNVGEHPFVSHPSFVFYAKANAPGISELGEAFRVNMLRFRESVEPELLARIRRGAMKTPHLRRKYKKLLQDQGLVPQV